MPIPTPFHPRTLPLCESYQWKEWAGYYAVCTYDCSPEREYNAIRQQAGLLDVTPLYKYDVTGPDAGPFLSRVMVRGVTKLKVGRMTYLCWCDDDGKVLDDGTCARLAPEHYRVTAASPAYHWFIRHTPGFDVTIEDVTDSIAALALQGPTSRDILRRVSDADMDGLKFFGVTPCNLAGRPGWISRTGYTGDLGYEIWVDNDDALNLWDGLLDEGKDHGIEPVGLDALDITRIEAGFILHGVDYTPADAAIIALQKSSPFELNLEWTVKLNRAGPFIGQGALRREAQGGSEWAFVGLEIDWAAIESMFAELGLPPQVPSHAWRCNTPIYHQGQQVGRATSGTWSPVLKKNLALGTVQSAYAAPGTHLDIEVTVEWSRRMAPAVVRPLPFFDPPRKRA